MPLGLLLAAAVGLAGTAGIDERFDQRFTGRTLRLDYHHTGSATEEHVALDRVRLEGDWAGSRVHLVDDGGLGKYLFLLVDPESGRPLFAQGFASIYGEWETTGAAKEAWGSFEESQRFPEPKGKARMVLRKRGADGAFHDLWSAELDSGSRFVERSSLTRRGSSFSVLESGPPATKVDLLLLSSGYAAERETAFRADVERLVGVLLATEPFASRKRDFNVRALFLASPEGGISDPRKGVWRDDPLGLSFNAFDTDRYVLTFANRELREAAAQVPYDALIVLFDARKYGGGGIYNLWSTCAAGSSESAYLFVHEFGHAFAGLADEYYSSQVSYEGFQPPGVEPWEPNVTALLDPKALKWRDLVQASTPLPTPWGQEGYDAIDREYQKKRKALLDRQAGEDEAEALYDEVRRATQPVLAAEPHFGKVGAFQGAMYEAKGLYRPEVDCIMFTRNPKSFCRVCARAIERAIDRYAE